jgi:hypothetical protein
MSENVKVRGGRDNAVLLLEAAEKMDLDPSVVRTTSFGFEVPKEVASKAGVEIDDSDAQFEKEVEQARKAADKGESLSRSGFEEQKPTESIREAKGEEPKKAPAKKAPAKKAAKKAPAKKAAAKKSTGKES